MSEPTVTPNGSPFLPDSCTDAGAGGPWDLLRSSLQQLAWRCVRHLQSAEDLAGEVVLHAWKRFGLAAQWQDLWSWSLRVVRGLIAKLYRTAARARTEVRPEFDGCCAPLGSAPLNVVVGNDFVACLWSRLQPTEQATLSHLVAGAHSNEAIAAAMDTSLRAVERSRSKLRLAASHLGK